jgi:hypothetical protein
MQSKRAAQQPHRPRLEATVFWGVELVAVTSFGEDYEIRRFAQSRSGASRVPPTSPTARGVLANRQAVPDRIDPQRLVAPSEGFHNL